MEEKFDEIFEIAETQYNVSRTHFADLTITFYKNEHYGYCTNILDSDAIKQLIKSELKALGRQKEELAKCEEEGEFMWELEGKKWKITKSSLDERKKMNPKKDVKNIDDYRKKEYYMSMER